MGRIKTDMVKRTTRKLLAAYSDKFAKSFTKNKEALGVLAEVRSKKLRNVIAGYASRLKTQEETAATNIRRRRTPSSGEDSYEN
jgi:small subunit ribosomal protein S17e